MLFVYPAIFFNEKGAYRVEFPDLKGCHACGTNLNETMGSAQEALTTYLLALLEDGAPLAAPSDMTSIHLNADSDFSTLVTCEIDPYKDVKAVKKTLTIPSWMNDRAAALGTNFSGVLQEALLLKIQAK